MTIKEVLKFVENSHGKIFSIRFTKRTTGESRDMTCRTDVTSRLRGGEAAYSFEEKGLLIVFDMHKNDYRTIPKEGITHLKVKGEWVEVTYPVKEGVK